MSIIHSSNPTKDIQNAIDSAKDGDIIYLGNGLYSIRDSIIFNKSISIIGGILLDNIDSSSNQLLSSDNPLFIISGKNTVDLINMTVILDNNDLFILSLFENSTNPTGLDIPIVNIINNTFLKNNDDVEESSIYLVKSISERPLLESLNNINIENNNLRIFINRLLKFKFVPSNPMLP